MVTAVNTRIGTVKVDSCSVGVGFRWEVTLREFNQHEHAVDSRRVSHDNSKHYSR